MKERIVWTPENVRHLEKMWEDGVGQAEIGRRLKCSKSAIANKIKRLELQNRPTPIRRDRPSRPDPSIRAGAGVATIEALATVPQMPPSVANYTAPAFGKARSCQFPLWGHAERPKVHRFCGAGAAGGSSYCSTHRARCYTPMTVDRRHAA